MKRIVLIAAVALASCSPTSSDLRISGERQACLTRGGVPFESGYYSGDRVVICIKKDAIQP